MSDNIYAYIEKNFNITINDYIFKRDYIKYPLQKIKLSWEIPYQEDLEYLYITLNLSIEQLRQLFKIYSISKFLRNYNIKKDKMKAYLITMQTKLEKYGDPHYCDRDKLRKTNLEKYGVEYSCQSDIVKNKSLDTKLKKYGNPYYCDRDKLRKTNLEKYGVEYYTQTDEYKKKSEQTCLQKYGVKSYTQTTECQNKIKQTKLEKYGDENYFNIEKYKKTCMEKYGDENYNNFEKYRKTCMEKYGVEYYTQTDEYKKKSEQTNLKRYGVKCYLQTDEFKNYISNPDIQNEINQKRYNTKKQNNTFSTSQSEELIYNLLCKKFDNVIRQYRSEKYPFDCDFYIPSIDTYIEYQGTWHHGKEPYIGSEKQQQIIEKWKAKSLELNFQGNKKCQYSRAINIWTIEDPSKRQAAKENNLNWFEFFDMTQFLDWFNIIQNKTT